MDRILLTALSAALLAGAACYRVHPIECSLTCSEGICPSGLTCRADGYCHGEGHTELCGPGGDGGVDGRTCSEEPVGLTAGFQHTCAAAGDDAVWCWGANASGQFGDGTVMGQDTPTRSLTWPSPVQLAAGGDHTCVLDPSGLVHCAGLDTSGQLGDGDPDTSSTGAIVDVVGLPGVEEISAHGAFACARVGGQVFCWGANESGQLGTGTVGAAVPAPGPVMGIADATAIANGTRHACAVQARGAVSCWGFGYLGNGAPPPGGSAIPVQVAASGYARVGAGLDNTCAIGATGGAVACWGVNDHGQCGTGDASPVLTPTPNGVIGAVELALGPAHSCARLADGTVWCWGQNQFGQLGDGTIRNLVAAPVQVLDVADAIDLAVGSDYSCAALADRTVRCWGNNDAGQLGDGTTRQRSSPITAAFDCTRF